jgi:hypothetical protein
LAQIETESQARRKARRSQMGDDMSKYASAGFIKVDDLADGPEQKTIVAIGDGRYEKPVATFDDGRKLSLNGTNVSALIPVLGKNRKDWIGQRVELYVGTLRYNGNDNPAVLVRALNPSPAAARTPLKLQPLRDDMADEVPF